MTLARRAVTAATRHARRAAVEAASAGRLLAAAPVSALDELVRRGELTHQVDEVASYDYRFHRRNDVYIRSTCTDLAGKDVDQ